MTSSSSDSIVSNTSSYHRWMLAILYGCREFFRAMALRTEISLKVLQWNCDLILMLVFTSCYLMKMLASFLNVNVYFLCFGLVRIEGCLRLHFGCSYPGLSLNSLCLCDEFKFYDSGSRREVHCIMEYNFWGSRMPFYWFLFCPDLDVMTGVQQHISPFKIFNFA